MDLPSLVRSAAAMLRAFLDLCRALQQLHSRGVVQNYIKANNMALRRHPDSGRLRVSLVDYGLTQAAEFRALQREVDHARAQWTASEGVVCAPCSPAGDVYSMSRLWQRLIRTCRRRPDAPRPRAPRSASPWGP